MAQPFKVDIFSDDIDVDAPSVKPPIQPLLPYLSRDTVPPPRRIPPNLIPQPAGKRKQWDSKKNDAMKKIKKQPPKAKPKPIPPLKKNNWHPIPAVGGSNNTRQIEKKPGVKFEMDRSNLKVVEGAAGSIQLNLDKSKGLTVKQEETAPKVIEKQDEPKPETPVVAPGVSNTQVNQQQNKPQNSAAKGRMPASAFMNIDQQIPRNPKQKQPIWPNLLNTTHPAYITYPKGIPKSFLTQKHMQQLQTPQLQYQNQNQSDPNPSPTKGPVWEAKIPSTKASNPVWTNIQSFDEPPSDQHTPGTSQTIGQGSQPFGPGQSFNQSQQYGLGDQSFGASGQAFGPGEESFGHGGQTFGNPIFVQSDFNTEESKPQYSPSDAYADMALSEINDEIPGESLDSQQSGSKRLSAFQRLGPVTQPKKPKLTINLLVGKEQAVREVVDESENPEMDKYTPMLERPDIQTSLDDTVMKFIAFWPWKKPPAVRRNVTARESKNVMQVELEQMEEHYEKDKMFFGILVTLKTITRDTLSLRLNDSLMTRNLNFKQFLLVLDLYRVHGYPESWNKEDVLDALLEAVKGKSFIPCFIEFTKHECKFLVIRCRQALLAIHKFGFSYRKDDVVLKITICQINLSVNQIDFIPRLILRKRLSMAMDGETELNLKQFTLEQDVSHFLYFPLNRATNQAELVQLQSSVPWPALTKLVLSHNKITTLSGFDLPTNTPKLKHLDLSFNRIEGITTLLPLRALPLNCLLLEGNPLCADYIEQERYTKVLKMMFSGLKEIDGVKLTLKGDLPPYKRNYSPPGAAEVATKLLETLFPLLDADPEERRLCEDLYMHDAVMTVTFMYKLRYGPIYKDYRTLFSRARILDEDEMDAIEGADAIAKIIHRWPKLEHDPLTFNVDVIYHTDTTTMLRISGIMKLTAETLAEDEHLLHFTRTLVLHSLDSREYKITNEMIYWDLPDKEHVMEAFRMTTVRSKNLNLKLDAPPDAELREKLLEIFMQITTLGRKPSERCLATKDWHLRNALEYFSKLLKLDNLDPLFG